MDRYTGIDAHVSSCVADFGVAKAISEATGRHSGDDGRCGAGDAVLHTLIRKFSFHASAKDG